MNKSLILITLATLNLSINTYADVLEYPIAPTTNQIDTFHGIQVEDPYRWMEDNNSAALKEWIDAENKLTFSFLESIPERKRIMDRLSQLWNYERYGIPFKQNNRYFIFKNDGLQNQSVLYTAESLDAELKVLLDPNTLAKDGTIALSGISLSEDGNWMAYGLSSAGSDWQEWRVRNIYTTKDTIDHIQWVKFSSAVWRWESCPPICSHWKRVRSSSCRDSSVRARISFMEFCWREFR